MSESQARFPALKHYCEQHKSDGSLSYYEIQGFLFAVVGSPEPVEPEEWLPMALGKEYPKLADDDTIDDAARLYALTVEDFEGDEVMWPDGVTLSDTLEDNFGVGSPLGEWSRGFSLGHHWLSNIWDAVIPEDEQQDLADALFDLGFFSDRETAEDMHSSIIGDDGPDFETVAEELLDRNELISSMVQYMDVSEQAKELYEEIADQPDTEIVSRQEEGKVGRNDPCPCGSGKKYKKCCLH